MRLKRILIHRLRSLFRRQSAERDLAREIELHVDQLTRQYRDAGLSEAEARSAARREFGPVDSTKEVCRDARRVGWLEDLLRDIGQAGRSLWRSPAFAITAIVTIALGIGVNTAVFSVIYTVLLDPLPFHDPERLVHIAETHPEFPSFQVAAPDVSDFQRMATSFDQIAAHTFQAMNKWTILGDGEPEPVQVVQASSALFGMLGMEPLLGRSYTAEEEQKKSPVVVISESLWRRKYGSDPAVIGRTIRLVGWPVMVVGIVSQRQAQPGWGEVWLPLTFLDPALAGTRRFHTLMSDTRRMIGTTGKEVIARLKPGVTIEQAQTEMTVIAGKLAQTFPDTNGRIGVSVLPLSSWMTGEVRPALLIAWAAVSLVLLLACANVAHLVLVRTVDRSREFAVRVALGAGSARLARFLVSENLLVAAAGGVLGAVLARLSLPVLLRLASRDIPRMDSLFLTPAALAFGGCATVLCAALFALPAILHARKPVLHQIIKGSSGVSATHRRSWFGASIIAAEVALAFMVVTGAGLLYRSFAALLKEETGFDARGVLAADVPLALRWEQSAKIFEQQVAPALRAIPGVTMVAAVNCGPMILRQSEVSRFATRFGVAGQAFPPGQFPVAQARWITPDYFRTLRIPLRRGRLFTESDIGKPVYIINEELARRFFPDRDPIGRQILMNVFNPSPDVIPIIGVVGDVRDLGLDIEPRPTIYSLAVSNKMTVLIRSEVPPESLVTTVRGALRTINPDSPITVLAPLSNLIATSVALRRFALELIGVFAMLAVVLTAVGVYGVISYSLSRRLHEFAIRYALGAGRGQVGKLILRDFAAATFCGLVVGAWLAYLCAGALRTQLYKLSPADPLVLAVSAIALLALVLASALRPAAKATGISPMEILRE